MRSIYYHGDAHQTGYEIINGLHTQRIADDAPIPAGWSLSSTPPAPDVLTMDKLELEEYARGFGIELDRRKTLANMRADFERARQ